MQILILGGDGMLGHKVFQILHSRFPDVMCSVRGNYDDAKSIYPILSPEMVVTNLDVMDLNALENRLNDLQPKYVINCVGVIKQRSTAQEAIPSITINSLLPHKLADILSAWDGRLFHFSTDCVFNGKSGGYTETSPSDAEDLYGRSKFLGEVGNENALTLRTSIIGRELKSFVSLLEWFLSNRGGKIKGFRRVIYSGVTTNYIGQILAELISNQSALSGVYQVASPPISKYDLLCRLNEAYGTNVAIEPDDEVVSDRSMKGDKFFAASNLSQPSWSDLIEDLVKDPTPYDDWRA